MHLYKSFYLHLCKTFTTMKQTRVISFYTDKGGTGKTTMNVTLCSYLAYKLGYSVILFDTDYPSLHAHELRKRELEAIEKDIELREFVQQSFSGDIRPYEIFAVRDDFDRVVKTLQTVKNAGNYDFIIIDLPGALNNDFVKKIVPARIIDNYFLPTTLDKTVMVSNIKLGNLLKGYAKDVQIVWNNVFHYDKPQMYDAYSRMLIESYGISVLRSRVKNTVYLRREMGTERNFFKSTLCYPEAFINKNRSNIPDLFNEIIEITQTDG